MSQLRSVLFKLNVLRTNFRTAHNKIIRRHKSIEKAKDQPVKFTTSEAYVNYKATLNFAGDTRDLPVTHNAVIAGTFMFAVVYLLFLRDDLENDGGKNLIRPVHETLPHLAIPMLEAAIVQNKKFGYDTSKLEKKLAECRKEPEKYGGNISKMIEN